MSASASAASLGGGADVEDDEDECVVCFEAERNAREWRRWQADCSVAVEGSTGARCVACVAVQRSAREWWGLLHACPFRWANPPWHSANLDAIWSLPCPFGLLPRLRKPHILPPVLVPAVCMPCGHRNLCSQCARKFVNNK